MLSGRFLNVRRYVLISNLKQKWIASLVPRSELLEQQLLNVTKIWLLFLSTQKRPFPSMSGSACRKAADIGEEDFEAVNFLALYQIQYDLHVLHSMEPQFPLPGLVKKEHLVLF